MRLMVLLTMTIGLSACTDGKNDAAFCGPAFTGAIDRLALDLDHPTTRDELGKSGTAVVLAHDAGCK